MAHRSPPPGQPDRESGDEGRSQSSAASEGCLAMFWKRQRRLQRVASDVSAATSAVSEASAAPARQDQYSIEIDDSPGEGPPTAADTSEIKPERLGVQAPSAEGTVAPEPAEPPVPEGNAKALAGKWAHAMRTRRRVSS